MAGKSKKKFRILMSVFLSVVLLLGVAGNVALAYFSDVVTMYFDEIDVESAEAVEARDHSQGVASKISDEGIVLLQNNENMLPLTETTQINVFGWSFTNPVYGGTGSGKVNADTAVNPKQGLENAGFEVNEQLYNDYVATGLERPIIDMDGQDWTIPEPLASDFYTDERMQQAVDFSDTAVIFIARSGGEGADLPRVMDGPDTFDPDGGSFSATGNRYGFEDDLDPDKHYLQLSNREQDMVDIVTEHFENVVLVVNSSNTFELSWVDEYSEIKSVLSVAGAGQNGFDSLGNILTGEVNPSGRTVDIYTRDLLDPPAMTNFGDFNYVIENADGSYSHAVDERDVLLKYVEYTEGIYVGYRFYETAAAEGIINYDDEVQFPFGYGLSYTTFEQEVVPGSLNWDDETISFDVSVTNTGSVAGKEVIQAYFSAPYTGNIERSAIDLAAFDKTDIIDPGESETVNISFAVEEMAAFDYNRIYSDTGSYVLEEGEYTIYLNSNSNEVIEEVESRTLEEVVFDNGRSTDDQVPVNQFEELEAGEGSIATYLSRENGFENMDELVNHEEITVMTDDGEETVRGKLVDEDFVHLVNKNRYEIPEDTMTEAPTTGVDNGLMLDEFTGVDFHDESWDDLLDQLSVNDMVDLVTLGGYRTVEIETVGKPVTHDYDGPSGITAYTSRSDTSGTAFPAGVMLAQTWNIDLATQMGESVGAEGQAYNVTGWYAPGINIHRSAFSGRNFEYYSEDPLVSGKMAANKIEGFESQGGFVYMKHFALNDQEENRTLGLMTWANEQTVRDIYLKPFEIAVKEGGASGVMSGFNSIGTVWAGASSNLLQEVLRNEWGFRGHVNTDFFLGDFYPYMVAELGFRNGNDLLLTGTAPVGVPEVNTSSNDTLWAMRDASHNILYTVANSGAIDDPLSSDMPTWVKVTIAVDIALLAAIIGGFYFTFRKPKIKVDPASN
ncbi:glycoside hydrolase family 3 protein [Halalkalibacter sp. APA_J-10(15)]|uniref:glycoside hydrolase family 3 protein n=1 Tax=Halalkalibacter sp. APA_J-10(15) TaxID=2933805 RepID=UPI001FF482AB|nr:glycoside hydrolase family 3 protein [Halalkalibacter sp. APA_J-10(15)]MCK0472298.1 glycoside hydrolase family 3 C-terminal domain-containing protein [Halalkalibacter sp. APA_J-10(15)]